MNQGRRKTPNSVLPRNFLEFPFKDVRRSQLCRGIRLYLLLCSCPAFTNHYYTLPLGFRTPLFFFFSYYLNRNCLLVSHFFFFIGFVELGKNLREAK